MIISYEQLEISSKFKIPSFPRSSQTKFRKYYEILNRHMSIFLSLSLYHNKQSFHVVYSNLYHMVSRQNIERATSVFFYFPLF